MQQSKPKVPFITIAAALGGFVIMLLGAYLEGSPIMGFLNLPAFLIVGGGTFGASLAALGLERFMQIGKAWLHAQQYAAPDWATTAESLVRAADLARKEGLLRLEDEAKNTDDEFMQMCFQLLADGVDPAVMREILWAKIESEHHHVKGYSEIFEKMGGFAPTMGIIGTVMGLTHALQLLSQPEKLGPAIAGAFMATLYGVASANLIWIPTSDRLKAIGEEQKDYRGMMVAATMSIQRGDNSRQVADKLASMSPVPLDPDALRGKSRGGE